MPKVGKRNSHIQRKGKQRLKSTQRKKRKNTKMGKKWIQKANRSIKRRGTKGVCTGAKFGGPSCPPGSKRYNLAKTFKKMAKKRRRK